MIPRSLGLTGRLAADPGDLRRLSFLNGSHWWFHWGRKVQHVSYCKKRHPILNKILPHDCHDVLRASNIQLSNATFPPWRAGVVLLPPSGQDQAT